MSGECFTPKKGALCRVGAAASWALLAAWTAKKLSGRPINDLDGQKTARPGYDGKPVTPRPAPRDLLQAKSKSLSIGQDMD